MILLTTVLLQKEHQIHEFQEGNGNVPVCLKLNKQSSVDDLNSKLPLGNLI